MSDNPTPQDIIDVTTRNWAVGTVIQSRQSADGQGNRPILTTYDAMYVAIAADILANYVIHGLEQAGRVHEHHKELADKLVETDRAEFAARRAK